MLVKLEQPEKASFPIEVTELGMVMLAKLEQPRNASSPIEVTELPILTLASPLQL